MNSSVGACRLVSFMLRHVFRGVAIFHVHWLLFF